MATMISESEGASLSETLPGVPVNWSSSETASFFSLSFEASDKLKICGLPPTHLDLIRECILTYWVRGIKSEGELEGHYVFKLKGYPWLGRGRTGLASRKTRLESQKLVTGLLMTIAEAGWVLGSKTRFGNYQPGAETLIFYYHDQPPKPCTWMSVSFHYKRHVRFVNASSELMVSITESFLNKQCLQSFQLYGEPDCYDVQVGGVEAPKGDAIPLKCMTNLVSQLESKGWYIHASINPSRRGRSDTWYCCKRDDWVPGQPAYGAQ